MATDKLQVCGNIFPAFLLGWAGNNCQDFVNECSVCFGFFCRVAADAGNNCADVPNILNGVFSYGEDCAGLGTFGMAIDAAIDIARRDGRCSADTQSVQKFFSEDHSSLFDWLLSHASPTVQRERDVTRRTWVPKTRCWAAGCPCQPDSSQGSKLRDNDERSRALKFILKWLASSSDDTPDGIILESVKGLTHDKHRFAKIIATLKKKSSAKWQSLTRGFSCHNRASEFTLWE